MLSVLSRGDATEGSPLMHDIWNPWHGCIRKSEGCDHCYMYYQDAMRGRDGSVIYRTNAGFDLPLQRDRTGAYRIRSGEMLRVCMNSDFFLPEADAMREDAWEMMRMRPDVVFFLLTKRPERVADCLPKDFGDGRDYRHIFMNVSAENQRRADERIPILLSLPFYRKGVMCAPLIGPVDLERYLPRGICQVLCDGENYGGAQGLRFRLGEIAVRPVRPSGRALLLCRDRQPFPQGRADLRAEKPPSPERNGEKIGTI